MATAPETLMPTPRYPLGTPVFMATTESTTEKLPCPDCLGTGKWTATSPAGQEFTLGCPRCGDYTYHDLPRLHVRRHVAKVRALTITGYEVSSDGSIEYKATGGGSGWYNLTEGKIVTDREAAEKTADLLARLANADEDKTVEALAARHFGSMRLEEAQFDRHRNGMWEAYYHAGALIDRVRYSIYGKEDAGDDDEPQSADKAIEDLRDVVRWDLQYHIDSLPLSNVIRAAAQSTEPAIVEAMAKLPDSMVSLFTASIKPADQPSDLPF